MFEGCFCEIFSIHLKFFLTFRINSIKYILIWNLSKPDDPECCFLPPRTLQQLAALDFLWWWTMRTRKLQTISFKCAAVIVVVPPKRIALVTNWTKHLKKLIKSFQKPKLLTFDKNIGLATEQQPQGSEFSEQRSLRRELICNKSKGLHWMVLSARQKPAGQAGNGEDLGHDSKDWDGIGWSYKIGIIYLKDRVAEVLLHQVAPGLLQVVAHLLQCLQHVRHFDSNWFDLWSRCISRKIGKVFL